MPLLSIKDVAKLLNVSKETVRRQVISGVYQSVKIGRQHRLPSEQFNSIFKMTGMVEMEEETKAEADDVADLL